MYPLSSLLCSGALWQEHLNLHKFHLAPFVAGWLDKRCCASSYCKHVQLPMGYMPNVWYLPRWSLLFRVSCPKLESISSMQRPTIHLPSLQCFKSCLLLVATFAIYCCYLLLLFTFTITIITIISLFPLIFCCKLVYFRCGCIDNSTVKAYKYSLAPRVSNQ